MDLVIKQNIDRTETVSSSFIDTLYHLTKPDSSTGQSLANAVLVGRIQSTAAYEDAVNFLNDKFSSEQDNGSDLQVTVLNNNYYIRFADEEVVRVLVSQGVMEEGEGLTIAQASTANVNFRSLFNGNTVVKNFDELRYFDKYKTTGGSGAQQIFDGAKNLESVDLTGIQSTYLYWAFRNCHSLEWYHGKNGPKNVLNLEWRNVSSIQANAFNENYGLHEVTSLGIVTVLDGGCFQQCTNLTTIDISSITIINSSVFDGDGNLEYFSGPDSTAGELDLPNLTGTLGSYAFKGCVKLTSVTSLGNITRIGREAFNGCAVLSTVGTDVIENGTLKTKITNQGSVNYIETNAFNNTSWLTSKRNSLSVNGGPIIIDNALYEYVGALTGSYTIPDGVYGICPGAFNNKSDLTSITFPSSVKLIGDTAFKKCSALTAINIPDTVEEIYQYAFDSCTAATSLYIGSSVKLPGTYYVPFTNCGNLESIIVSENNTRYASKVNGVECNCIINKSDNTLYCGCKNTIIPNTVTKITQLAFENCTGLTSITIPNSVTGIEQRVFNGCTGLTSVTIPNSVKSIGNSAFSGCSSLTSVTIPDGVTSIGSSVFSSCTNLTSINIPNSITSIPTSAFQYCNSLTSVTIPDSVTSIGNWAFQTCRGLTSLTIGNGVTCIGISPFQNCSSLTSITINAVTPPTLGDSNVFQNTNNCPIYVPAASVSAYQSASGWSTYADRIQAIQTT